jgi:hypothetical protein
MAVAFGVTKILGPYVIAPGLKVAVYKLQDPEVSVEAGHTMDVSADFNHVYAAQFGPSGAAADFSVKHDLIGTYAATGTAAASVKVVHHFGQATVGAFDIVTAGTDLKACDDMMVTVWGA